MVTNTPRARSCLKYPETKVFGNNLQWRKHLDLSGYLSSTWTICSTKVQWRKQARWGTTRGFYGRTCERSTNVGTVPGIFCIPPISPNSVLVLVPTQTISSLGINLQFGTTSTIMVPESTIMVPESTIMVPEGQVQL